ncbi:MFS transporter [Companilactobacillus crustorum]|uniref:MFS transporter n=1 Tax=Companilactobacillus crustorum TaxID=392416 RepID=UPI003AB0E154
MMAETKKSNLILIMIAIFIATFMTSVETTIVTTALPTIISNLNGLSMQSWVFAMYLLTTAVSTPIYGKMSDRIGRKPIFIIGLIVFCTGSFLCGIAGNIYFLILFRALQGIGAGAIMPITYTIIADLFPYSRRSNMLAMNNTAWGISALLGPLLGGFIVDRLNWHWIFFINLPLGAIVLLLVIFGLKEQKREHQKQPIDFRGIISLSITLIALLIFFQSVGSQNLSIISVLISGIVFLIFIVLFYQSERKAIDPIIPLKLFEQRLFTIQILTLSLLNGIQIGFQIYFPIWLQSIYKVPASVAGLAVTPSPVMWLISSIFVGALTKRFSPRRITLPIVLIQILFYIPLLFAQISFPMFIFYIIAGITGAGLGIVVTTNILVSQEIVDKSEVGTVSSMQTLGRTLGQTITTGVFGLIFNIAVNSSLGGHNTVSFNQVNQFISTNEAVKFSGSIVYSMEEIILNGMHAVFLATVVVFIIAFIINLLDKNRDVIK